MLFNSFIFIFGFLPLALIIFYGLGARRQSAASIALTLLSLGFYAWWRPVQLPILLFSIVFNYWVGGAIQKAFQFDQSRRVRWWLTFGVLVDVGLLGWFKYANFIVDNLNALGADITLNKIALPLAISFFTFQKIAYLVDSAQGKAKRMTFPEFALFASFFPQLISGPIVHYSEVVPQFRRAVFGRVNWRNLMVGLVIFSIGLFKKTALADSLAPFADPLYRSVEEGARIGALGGWLAAVTYTFQLYFDFSGYSDMAIGLGRMLGVKLPLNFHSPLRAASMIDYWRRWHMTLQRFLVAYVFTPVALPLNRSAAELGLVGWSSFIVGVVAPILATFLVSGLWHGAGWTYVAWGLLHGSYIAANEAWREHGRRKVRALRKAGKTPPVASKLTVAGCHTMTLLAIVFANVMFRAKSIGAALSIWAGMMAVSGASMNGLAAPPSLDWPLTVLLTLCAFIVFMTPNTQQIMGHFDPARNWAEWRDVGKPLIRWTWKPTPLGAVFAGVTLFLGIAFIQRGQAVFIYFNF
jgi:alginate O-acetyltransferase complex protein AlgI